MQLMADQMAERMDREGIPSSLNLFTPEQLVATSNDDLSVSM